MTELRKSMPTKKFVLGLAAIVVSASAYFGWYYWEKAKCKACDEHARKSSEQVHNALGRLHTELIELDCNPGQWHFEESHLRWLVGPYYGFRGGNPKCDVRSSVQGDEIWVCAGNGTRPDGPDTRRIYRVSTKLADGHELLPPITGPLTGKRYPIEIGGIPECFMSTMVDPKDCSFRNKRKPRTAANHEMVQACEKRLSEGSGKNDNLGILAKKCINPFGLEIYGRFDRGEHNLVFSPLSIFTPLAMGYEGARGETRDQMAKVLRINELKVALHPTLGSLISTLDCSVASADGLLLTANALWGQKNYGFKEEYQTLMSKHYGSGIKEADFKDDLKGAEETINKWVANQTQQKITQMISLVQSPETPAGLLSANTIYFNCAWANKFPVSDTKYENFTFLSGNKIKVPMMNITRNFKYMEGKGFKALELPYAGRDISMIVLLPNKDDGLIEFENSVNGKNLAEWIELLNPWPAGVIVFLPRFYINSRFFNMSGTLEEMGIRRAFERFKADFSGITGERPPPEQLFMAGFVHEAGIDVAEEGTEAWAASVDCRFVGGSDGDDPTKPKVFRADHPFMFMIVHYPSQCILFMGRVTEPH